MALATELLNESIIVCDIGKRIDVSGMNSGSIVTNLRAEDLRDCLLDHGVGGEQFRCEILVQVVLQISIGFEDGFHRWRREDNGEQRIPSRSYRLERRFAFSR